MIPFASILYGSSTWRLSLEKSRIGNTYNILSSLFLENLQKQTNLTSKNKASVKALLLAESLSIVETFVCSQFLCGWYSSRVNKVSSPKINQAEAKREKRTSKREKEIVVNRKNEIGAEKAFMHVRHDYVCIMYVCTTTQYTYCWIFVASFIPFRL